MTAVHSRLVAALDRARSSSATDAAAILRLRELLWRRDFDPWSRASEIHVTGSAIVVDPAERSVLLRWHQRLGRWAQLGGHADPGEDDPWTVALREASEESGLTDLRPWPGDDAWPLQVTIVPVPASAIESAHEHADIRFALSTASPRSVVAENGDAPLHWVAITQVAQIVDDPGLIDLVDRVRELIDR